MNLRDAPGFLGSNASLMADLTLVAILLMVIAMLIGFSFARRKMFVPHHKFTMTTVVIIIWILVAFQMAVTYSQIPNEPSGDLPTIHLLIGAVAQVLATILVIRMWFSKQLPKALKFEPIKPWMRLTLALWLITAVLGVGIYVTFYGLPFSKH